MAVKVVKTKTGYDIFFPVSMKMYPQDIKVPGLDLPVKVDHLVVSTSVEKMSDVKKVKQRLKELVK